MFKLLVGDALTQLKTLESESVNTIVTSPPYFNLRDYGVDGQIGLEETPEEFIRKLVEVFREARRVLRKDGTLWANIGDSYVSPKSGGDPEKNSTLQGGKKTQSEGHKRPDKSKIAGLKPKDLIGIPWMLAFALRADGWWLRQDIIWAKKNCMPESVTDRCTKSHEYIFLLSKSERYYFDNEAIKEPAVYASSSIQCSWDRDGKHSELVIPNQRHSQHRPVRKSKAKGEFDSKRSGIDNGLMEESFRAIMDTRNKRSVWSVPTKPYSEAHFAVFPPDLIEPCILAGCPKGGTVLDPFIGSGTTAQVALKHGRNCIGIDLNPANAKLIERRLAGLQMNLL